MKLINKIKKYFNIWSSLPKRLNLIHESIGRLESKISSSYPSNNFLDSEFKIYSQWGEDGIIQHLLKFVPILNKTFVEFGVENYLESNTRFLLINNNWSGLVLDGDPQNIEYIKRDMNVFYAHNLNAQAEFVTVENINLILNKNGINGDIGILSIDIDGNDYWIWDEINCIQPRIVICEYNSHFGPECKITTPYNSNFIRNKAHFSNIYYGASIAALEYLANKKGYSLICSNSAGNNVFFVRNDLVGLLRPIDSRLAYIKAQFKESKNTNNQLDFKTFEERLNIIKDLDVVDVETNEIKKISECLKIN